MRSLTIFIVKNVAHITTSSSLLLLPMYVQFHLDFFTLPSTLGKTMESLGSISQSVRSGENGIHRSPQIVLLQTVLQPLFLSPCAGLSPTEWWCSQYEVDHRLEGSQSLTSDVDSPQS